MSADSKPNPTAGPSLLRQLLERGVVGGGLHRPSRRQHARVGQPHLPRTQAALGCSCVRPCAVRCGCGSGSVRGQSSGGAAGRAASLACSGTTGTAASPTTTSTPPPAGTCVAYWQGTSQAKGPSRLPAFMSTVTGRFIGTGQVRLTLSWRGGQRAQQAAAPEGWAEALPTPCSLTATEATAGAELWAPSCSSCGRRAPPNDVAAPALLGGLASSVTCRMPERGWWRRGTALLVVRGVGTSSTSVAASAASASAARRTATLRIIGLRAQGSRSVLAPSWWDVSRG